MVQTERKKAYDRERMRKFRAGQVALERVSHILLSYEPLHGSSVFDLERAVRENVAYEEQEA